jgi:hypothetical protein
MSQWFSIQTKNLILSFMATTSPNEQLQPEIRYLQRSGRHGRSLPKVISYPSGKMSERHLEQDHVVFLSFPSDLSFTVGIPLEEATCPQQKTQRPKIAE